MCVRSCEMCSVSCVVLCGVEVIIITRSVEADRSHPPDRGSVETRPSNPQQAVAPHLQQQQQHISYQGTGILTLSSVMGSDAASDVRLFKFG